MTNISVILPCSSHHDNLKTSPKRKRRTISKLPGGGVGIKIILKVACTEKKDKK